MAAPAPPADAAAPPRDRPQPPVVVRQTDGGINIATVASDGLSVEEGARRYALAINGLFDTTTLTSEPHATLHGFFLGALHITFGTISARRSRRTAALCAGDRADSIILHLVRAGRWRARIGGRSLDGGSGTIILFDLAQPFTIGADADQELLIVTIPRHIATRLAHDPATLHGRTPDRGMNGILAMLLDGLVTQVEALTLEQAPALADLAIDLAALALGSAAAPPTAERRGPERRLRDRVEGLIAMRLNAQDLTPDWIARKIGVSRSELYAAFPAGRGIARLIWDKRLDTARSALSDPLDDRTVGAIARLYGFASDAHFARAFKQRFGLTPTAARRAARA